MAKTKGPAKRFGARYGRTIRAKINLVEAKQKKIYDCPYCKEKKVKRIFVGVWGCKKCGAKFTGRAYEV